jgi:hypothetical protein
MALPIKLPPGVILTDSANATEGRWTGGQFVHFIGKFPEKWLGWRRVVTTQLDGAPRGCAAWSSVDGDYNIAVGTWRRAYVLTGGDAVVDVTPIRDSGTLGNDPFATTIGLTRVVVSDTSHGLAQGAVVEFDGATAGGGITIDGEYIVTEIIDANSYAIEHSIAASGTDATTGGAAVTYVYRINPGNISPTVGTGWGTGGWSGSGGWSEPTIGGAPEDMRYWSMQSYGNNLLAVPFGGTLYQWLEGTDDELQEITQAPDYIRAMFVTAERFVFALGTSVSNPMKIEWPDQNDLTDWTPTDINTANTRTLQYGSKIINGTSLVNKESLVWTDAGLYVFQYDGSDFVYNDRLVGKNCGLAGPLAFVEVNGVAYWMSGFGFHMYNGAVQDMPNQDDVLDYVFSDMNQEQVSKTFAQYDPVNGMILFFYVSIRAEDSEPDTCIEVNSSNWAWSPPHPIRRSCGTVVNPAEASVFMFDPDGWTFRHNIGMDGAEQDGSLSPIEAEISFACFSLTNGDENIDIVGFVPDCQRQTGQLEITLTTKDRPNKVADFDSQTEYAEEGDGILDFRVSGRYLGGLIRSNELLGDFRLGICQYEIQNAGKRR